MSAQFGIASLKSVQSKPGKKTQNKSEPNQKRKRDQVCPLHAFETLPNCFRRETLEYWFWFGASSCETGVVVVKIQALVSWLWRQDNQR